MQYSLMANFFIISFITHELICYTANLISKKPFYHKKAFFFLKKSNNYILLGNED
jgi:hypothetical protein